jgi:hypothetical protein
MMGSVEEFLTACAIGFPSSGDMIISYRTIIILFNPFSNFITCLLTSSPQKIPPPAGVLRNE